MAWHGKSSQRITISWSGWRPRETLFPKWSELAEQLVPTGGVFCRVSLILKPCADFNSLTLTVLCAQKCYGWSKSTTSDIEGAHGNSKSETSICMLLIDTGRCSWTFTRCGAQSCCFLHKIHCCCNSDSPGSVVERPNRQFARACE
jgi:hypothetical protein